MKPETKSKATNPIGLYHDKSTDTYIGCLDEIQADAVIQHNYVLVKEGREAAMTAEADMAKVGAPKKESK